MKNVIETIVGFLIILMFLYYIAMYSYILLFVILALSFLILYIVASIETKKEEKLKIKITQIKNKLDNYFNECIILDSNIYMDFNNDFLFNYLKTICKEKGYKIYLLGSQLDEIANIKLKSKYGTEKNKKARVANNIIEELQLSNILEIINITVDADKNAYADPDIITFIKMQNKNNNYNRCKIFTKDRDLRIRLRHFLQEHNSQDAIVDIDEFYEVLNDYEQVVV